MSMMDDMPFIPKHIDEEWAFGDILVNANGVKVEIQAHNGVLFVLDENGNRMSLQTAEQQGYVLKERIDDTAF